MIGLPERDFLAVLARHGRRAELNGETHKVLFKDDGFGHVDSDDGREAVRLRVVHVWFVSEELFTRGRTVKFDGRTWQVNLVQRTENRVHLELCREGY